MLGHTVAYPGVRQALQALAAYPLAVLTNKPVRFSRAILEGLHLAHFFQHVYGGNSFERKKPDPMGTAVLLREMKAGAREVLLVGDSDVDVQTARNAGTWSCGVTYGFGAAGFAAWPPDLLLDNLLELPARLNALRVEK
jgi:phosphoglycolate phosphatase